MNPENTQPQLTDEQVQTVHAQMQAQIVNLQQQVASANQAYLNLANTNTVSNMRSGRPEKFEGTNARSWLQSIRNIYESQSTPPTKEKMIKYAVSYMTGDSIQWWELVLLNKIQISTFDEFEKQLLKYFEPVYRELTARKILSELKQMSKFSSVRDYNKEFSR